MAEFLRYVVVCADAKSQRCAEKFGLTGNILMSMNLHKVAFSQLPRWSPRFIALLITILILPGGMLLLPFILSRSKSLQSVARSFGSQSSLAKHAARIPREAADEQPNRGSDR